MEFILGVSSNIYPKEFTGLLRGTEKQIDEVLVIPGSVFGESFATTRFNMIPMDSSIIGSIHSHPGNSFRPSKTDLRFFKKLGSVHLILKKPYKSLQDIAAYDREGNRISFKTSI